MEILWTHSLYRLRKMYGHLTQFGQYMATQFVKIIFLERCFQASQKKPLLGVHGCSIGQAKADGCEVISFWTFFFIIFWSRKLVLK